jgi:hypothetical protein
MKHPEQRAAESQEAVMIDVPILEHVLTALAQRASAAWWRAGRNALQNEKPLVTQTRGKR